MSKFLKNNIPWIEKYRPKSLNELCGNEEIIERLKNMRNTRDVANMILIGPSGTGKTSSIISLAKDILGEKFSEAIIELNASDDRNIRVVRETIREFASTKGDNLLVNNVEKSDIKLVILDEADSMTQDAQFCLRRIIETYSDKTRFCMICNYCSTFAASYTFCCIK